MAPDDRKKQEPLCTRSKLSAKTSLWPCLTRHVLGPRRASLVGEMSHTLELSTNQPAITSHCQMYKALACSDFSRRHLHVCLYPRQSSVWFPVATLQLCGGARSQPQSHQETSLESQPRSRGGDRRTVDYVWSLCSL